jgi:hypothetical protein
MKVLKLGSKGKEVEDLQKYLKIKVDGDFGPKTEEAVKKFQTANKLVSDGIVGEKTWNAMGFSTTTDLSETVMSTEKLIIDQKYMDKDEYLAGPTKKEYLFLHHTAGGSNPYQVATMWNNDTRGRVGTEFILGGQSVFNGNATYDGTIVQAFPEGAYGWHLGDNGSDYMHSHSVGIETCNFGPIKNGLTYTGQKADPLQVVELKQPFRGSKFYHRYSDKQLSTLKSLILYIANRDSIDIHKGLIQEIKSKGAGGFEFNSDAYYGKIKGMWTHTNTRKDKSDMFPQQELMDMLLSL